VPGDGPRLPRRPVLEDFIFEGEEMPLLLQRRVVLGIAGGFVLLVGVYVLVSRLLGLSYDIDPEPFRDWVDRRGILGPIVFIAALALSVLFAPIPNAPIFVAAGLAWGWLLGTAYAMAGMVLGSTIAFYVSRLVGRKHVARLIGHKAAQRLDQMAAHMGGRLVFWARMLPVVNFDWISFIAGLTSMRFAPFILYSTLGMLTPTTVAVVAGDGLGHDIRISLALGGVWVGGIVVSAAFFWYKQRRYRMRRAAAGRSAESRVEFRKPA
jgi:uncharacterized membrane protein YdjX (TVP38/TMEM64 family)